MASFAAAAEELNLTRSAVSHQILKLEKVLDVRLFDRRRDGVVLTPAGIKFSDKVRKLLLEVNDVTGAFLTKPRRQRLTVQSAPTIAARWLVARLDGFLASHADVDFQLIASTDLPDFRKSSVDLAICYGRRDWPGCETALLMSERVQPLCSPSLAARFHELQDLQQTTLIKTDMNLISWESWLAERGVRLSGSTRQVTLNPSYLALEGATRGLGVVLESNILAHGEIKSGLLVAPFDSSLAATNAYYLVIPSDERRRNAAAFRDWILQEAAAFGQ